MVYESKCPSSAYASCTSAALKLNTVAKLSNTPAALGSGPKPPEEDACGCTIRAGSAPLWGPICQKATSTECQDLDLRIACRCTRDKYHPCSSTNCCHQFPPSRGNKHLHTRPRIACLHFTTRREEYGNCVPWDGGHNRVYDAVRFVGIVHDKGKVTKRSLQSALHCNTNTHTCIL